MLFLTLLGEESPALTVVAALGKELQGQERMGGSTSAKVELDRVGRPAARLVLDHDKVDCEPPKSAGRCQPIADPLRRFTDKSGVRRVSREQAAEVALSAGAAKKLIMSRQQLHAPVGTCPELHTRTTQLLADDPLLDDAAILFEL